MTDALVFDAYGTLFDVQGLTSPCERLWPGLGQSISRTWRAKQLEYSWLRTLMGRYVDFEALTAEALRWTCESAGVRCQAADIEQLRVAYRSLKLFDDVTAALHGLGDRRRVILSNGSPAMLQAVVQNGGLGDMFDAVLSVDALRVYKPDPRVYQLAVDSLQVDARHVGFVSANGWDIAGARSFGFQTYWVNRASAPPERLGAEADHMLTSLTELVPLLA